MANVLNLAQVKAKLSHLNDLEERRGTNVASLKRLKEARDALLGKGGEVAGPQSHEDAGATECFADLGRRFAPTVGSRDG